MVNFAFLATFLIGSIAAYLLAGILHDIYDDTRLQENSSNVAETCRFVAGMRARESARVGSAFENKDPLAEHLAGPHNMRVVITEESYYEKPTPKTANTLALRTMALDDRIEAACSSPSNIAQVVVIGAGMDTRAYRLQLPHVKWFEVDMPEVISLKEDLLSTVPDHLKSVLALDNIMSLARIPINLKDNIHELVPVLEKNGFDKSAPALFLLEGVIMYLSVKEVKLLFETFPQVKGSQIVATTVSYVMRRLLTSPLIMDIVISRNNQFSSHKIAQLWRNDWVSLSFGSAFGQWKVFKNINIAVDQEMKRGLTLTDLADPWLPKMTKTIEYILDLKLNQ